MCAEFGYCLVNDSYLYHNHRAGNYFILVQAACPNLQRYHFFCYVFRTHSKTPAADVKCLCAWTMGVIRLCYCNADGMTKLVNTETNYQIICWYVLTRRTLHGYRLNICAIYTSTSRQRNVLAFCVDRRMEDIILLHARSSAVLCDRI